MASILLVIAILSILVLLHELGHFVAARRAGVDVEEFGFGLPPRLLGIKKGGTVFSLNLLPIGGFVRLKGESQIDRRPATFAAASTKNKVKILLAGVAVNALVGYLLLIFLALTGLPPVPGFEPDAAGGRLVEGPDVVALDVSEDSAAARAGIERGDVIVSGNGQAFSTPQQLQEFTLSAAGEVVELATRRNGELLLQQLHLDEGTDQGGQLGVLPLESYLVRYGPLQALEVATVMFFQVALATVAAFGQLLISLPQLIASLFGAPVVDTPAVGPVGITAIISNILFLGWRYILLIVISITTSLAVINSFPIPALDGGRLMMLGVSRLAGRDFSRRLESAIHLVGFVLLIMLIILITFMDIRRFI